MDFDFERSSPEKLTKSLSYSDIKQASSNCRGCLSKKQGSLCGTEYLHAVNDIHFQTLIKKSRLNTNDNSSNQECESLSWKHFVNDSKSILNDLNKTDYEYELDLENNNYEFKLNNYEICYDSSDFLEVSMFFFAKDSSFLVMWQVYK